MLNARASVAWGPCLPMVSVSVVANLFTQDVKCRDDLYVVTALCLKSQKY